MALLEPFNAIAALRRMRSRPVYEGRRERVTWCEGIVLVVRKQRKRDKTAVVERFI